jgi:hypothetical protein
VKSLYFTEARVPVRNAPAANDVTMLVGLVLFGVILTGSARYLRAQITAGLCAFSLTFSITQRDTI